MSSTSPPENISFLKNFLNLLRLDTVPPDMIDALLVPLVREKVSGTFYAASRPPAVGFEEDR